MKYVMTFKPLDEDKKEKPTVWKKDGMKYAMVDGEVYVRVDDMQDKLTEIKFKLQ